MTPVPFFRRLASKKVRISRRLHLMSRRGITDWQAFSLQTLLNHLGFLTRKFTAKEHGEDLGRTKIMAICRFGDISSAREFIQ